MRFALLLLFTAMVINICKKEENQSASTQNSILTEDDLPTIRALYNKAISLNSTATGSSLSFPKFIRAGDVNWEFFSVQHRKDGSVVTEFDLKSDTGVLTLTKLNPGDTIKYRNRTTVSFIKFKNGNRLNFYTTIVEDLAEKGKNSVINNVQYTVIPKEFTGLIMYFTLEKNI